MTGKPDAPPPQPGGEERPQKGAWRTRGHEIIFEADARREALRLGLPGLILLSMLAVCLEGVRDIRQAYGLILVWCPADNFRKAFELAEDGVGGGGPGKRSGMKIVVLDESVDALDELLDGGGGAAADGLMGDVTEPTFDLIEPGSVGGREVHVIARMCRQPGADFGVLVGGVVVDDEMELQVRRHTRVEKARKERNSWWRCVVCTA